jgi:hypothetical protein
MKVCLITVRNTPIIKPYASPSKISIGHLTIVHHKLPKIEKVSNICLTKWNKKNILLLNIIDIKILCPVMAIIFNERKFWRVLKFIIICY